jgi:hypothetical protein
MSGKDSPRAADLVERPSWWEVLLGLKLLVAYVILGVVGTGLIAGLLWLAMAPPSRQDQPTTAFEVAAYAVMALWALFCLTRTATLTLAVALTVYGVEAPDWKKSIGAKHYRTAFSGLKWAALGLAGIMVQKIVNATGAARHHNHDEYRLKLFAAVGMVVFCALLSVFFAKCPDVAADLKHAPRDTYWPAARASIRKTRWMFATPFTRWLKLSKTGYRGLRGTVVRLSTRDVWFSSMLVVLLLQQPITFLAWFVILIFVP